MLYMGNIFNFTCINIMNDQHAQYYEHYQSHTHILFIYIIPDIGIMVRVFANGLGDLVSIPGRVIPKTLKMVLDATLLNTQHYKVRVKWSNPRKGVVPYPTPWCRSYQKESLWVTLDYGHQLLIRQIGILFLSSSVFHCSQLVFILCHCLEIVCEKKGSFYFCKKVFKDL